MGLSHTVSGDIASFRTPSRVPIESLKFHFLPKQAAGTPSPENPIPIEGWTGLNGRRAGKNLIKPYYTEPTTYYGIPITPTANGVRVTGTAVVECAIRLSSMDVRFLDEGKKYTFSLHVNGDISGCKDPYIGYFDGVSYWGTMCSLTQENNYKFTWTVPNRYATAIAPWFDMYIRIREGSTVDFEIGLQMEEGSNATDYEPYSEEQIPITFPSNGKNIVDWPTPDGFSVAASLFNGWNADWIQGPIYVDRSNFGKRIIYSATIDNTNGIRDASLHVWAKDKNDTYVNSGITSEVVPVGSSKRVYAVVPITWTSWYKIYLGLTIGSGCIVSNPMAEYSMSMTTYEPYSSDNTFYGGYYNPITGEIVAEWGKKYLTGNEGWFTYGSLDSSEGISFACPMMDKKLGYKTSKCNMFDNVDGAWGSGHKSQFGIYSDHRTVENIYVRRPNEEISTLNDFKQWLSENRPEIIYELKTPIHIPIPAEDMKAFLDYNNFWSDANDITEVTYAVTESKDILATRKKAIDFDHAHHKKVKWNNFVNGYLSSDDWGDRDSNDTTTTFENGVSETTFLTKKRTFYTMRSKNEPRVYLSHKYFAYAEYSFDESFSQLPQIGFEFGGGKTAYGTPISLGDGWYYSRGIVSGNRDGGGYMYIPFLLVNSETDSGQKVKTRNVLYIDLTLMFGEGKEPATSNEFLKLCEINGINIHEPHSKDITGTDQWWIIP